MIGIKTEKDASEVINTCMKRAFSLSRQKTRSGCSRRSTFPWSCSNRQSAL